MRMVFQYSAPTASAKKPWNERATSCVSYSPTAKIFGIGFTDAMAGQALWRNPKARRAFPSTASYRRGGTNAREVWGLPSAYPSRQGGKKTCCAFLATDITTKTSSCTNLFMEFTILEPREPFLVSIGASKLPTTALDTGDCGEVRMLSVPTGSISPKERKVSSM